MTDQISVHGPGELLALLPYHLGYHPRRSVVVAAIAGRRLDVVARSDLPPEAHLARTAEAVVAPLEREGVRRAVVVGYEDVPDESLPLLTGVVERLERGRVEVLGVDVVRDGRRFSPVCSAPCCPREGEPLPSPERVPAVTELVARGRAPLADRDAVDRLVEPDAASGEGVAAALAAVTTHPRTLRRTAVRAWATVLADPGDDVPRHRTGGRSVAPGVVASAVAGLRDVPLRDALIGWLAPGVIPRAELDPPVVALLERRLPRWGGLGSWHRGSGTLEERHDVLERLLALCRCVPDECPRDAPAVCTAAAQVAWLLGDGAVARAALARALRLDPGYRLARLLAQLVESGVRPDRLGCLPPPLDRAG